MEKFSEKITWFMPLAKSDILVDAQTTPISTDRELFSSGRDALMRALKIENFSKARKLWIPEYFCPSVKITLQKIVDLKIYTDIPSEESPRFQSLQPNEGDAVLVVNFFGLRHPDIWDNWFANKKNILRIDDLSHAPFSAWSKSARADYVFASLRKTLPLLDGGYLWKKNSTPSNMFLCAGECSAFATDMLAAACTQETFGYDERAESLYYSGENKLAAKTSVSRISKYSMEILRKLDVEKIAKKTSENLVAFLSAFDDSDKCFELNRKFDNFIDPSSVFCPILKFCDIRLRDKVHNALFDIGAMPSIYWGGFGQDTSESTRIERDTTLAIPIDFRHSINDAERVGKFISKICADS